METASETVNSNESTWNKDKILDLINKRDDAVCRGIVAIYRRQTSQEQLVEATLEHNGVGFNGVDAELLTSLAKQVLDGKTLTEKQIYVGRKRIRKYSGQLAEIANANEADKPS